jgi:hypothetical protein
MNLFLKVFGWFNLAVSAFAFIVFLVTPGAYWMWLAAIANLGFGLIFLNWQVKS